LSYTQLVSDARVTSVFVFDLDRRDHREGIMGELLGEISEAEHAAGRGMLSVIVTHKNGDMDPGEGFFNCAEGLGEDVSSKDARLVTIAQQWKIVDQTWGK
jgi:hypothetical protein